MKVASFAADKWAKLIFALAIHVLSAAFVIASQPRLAITEVMSWPFPNEGYDKMDFWELTNFGTESVNLEEYRFCDGDHPYSAAWVFPELIISGGESIIFMRTNRVISSIEDFRNWWGTNLPPELQLVFYPTFGFDDAGDSVRVWDANGAFVDRVDFDQARRGFTFTYNTNTGEFGTISQAGVCGAWVASYPPDVGSPGRAPCGPVSIQITEQPQGQTVDAGEDVVLTVTATGRPPPTQYQWFFNGSPCQNVPAAQDPITTVINFANYGLAWVPSAKSSDLVLTNVQPAQSGDYFVVLSNGSESVTSIVVALKVNTNTLAPYVQSPSTNWLFPMRMGAPRTTSQVFLYEQATFKVNARGYPQPAIQWAWSSDGTNFSDILSATERTLVIPVMSEDSAGIYRVQLSNAVGTCYGYASLSVIPKPRLRISEVMCRLCDDRYGCWWELTNEGEEPVDLCGYMWDDSPGRIGSGPTITDDLIIEPRESVIFVEHLTAEDFIGWWGASNLPVNLKFINYSANGLAETGDMVRLWNAFALPGQENEQFVHSVSFSTANSCSSFWFDYAVCGGSEFGLPSVAGEGGAFQAAAGLEVGSPGWSRFTRPAFVSIALTNGTVHLQWRAQPGSINRLESIGMLASSEWAKLGMVSSSTSNASTNVTFLEGNRLYRLVQVTNAVPSCP